MTGNLLIDSLISLAAIGLMVLMARLAFPTPPGKLTEESAGERLAFDEPDFEPAAWLFDEEGRAALAEGKGGDYALVTCLSADLVTRRFPPGAVRAGEEDGALVLRLADPSLPRIRIAASDVSSWVRKFGADIGR